MLFYKSLVSFVTVIALASSAAAAATLERRQTQSCSTGSNTCCSTGSNTCCSTVAPFSGLSEGLQSGLVGFPNLNLDTPIGLDCVLPGLLGCNNQAFCCSGAQTQGGLINVGLNCVNL